MSKFLRVAATVLAILYLIALFLWAVGTFGWFESEEGPLVGAFLIPLGLPWNRLGEGLVIALLAPVINIFILMLLSRVAARRKA
ncbi:MAG: hypothetical protein ABI667_00570 [Sphingomicrobium sp.]